MKLAVIFGGESDEHEVSRNSAVNVLKNLEGGDHEIFQIGISRQGSWYLTDATYADIASGEWENYDSNRQVCFTCNPAYPGLVIIDRDGNAVLERIDCVIPVLHGDHGEDGEIQGVFEMTDIPYVGPGVKASANCMDKSVAKALAASTGVTMAKHYLVTKQAYEADPAGVIAAAARVDGGRFPLFVKPSSAGSSVGVTKVTEESGLGAAIELALKFDSKALVEECIVGRELEVAVLGNLDPEASDVGEILTAGEFYDYESKYNNPESRTWIPDDLPEGVSDEIRGYAVEIFKALECRGLSRVDFFYSEDKGVVFNEVNTLPGFTDISMYPQLWAARGVDGPALVEKLIELAIAEHDSKLR